VADSTFTNQDIADYYDQTEIHYRRAWDLEESLAMHYGFWRPDTKRFRESLQHMNEELARMAGITSSDRVLDAGCGVGGSAIFLAKTIGCQVKGITLSEKQRDSASQNALKAGIECLVTFEQQDFSNTLFKDESFDVIWGLESVVHAQDKIAFLKEAHRLLKPGGRLVMGEYYKKEEPMSKREDRLLKKWLHAWAVPDIERLSSFKKMIAGADFTTAQFRDITPNIRKASWRMFYGSLFLTVLSGLYRMYNPKVSHFADNHYKALFYQYPALRKGLWKYHLVLAYKKQESS
jgi:cyclopropane fatty-acyl-phospholipid synthase-like methyltransferase